MSEEALRQMSSPLSRALFGTTDPDLMTVDQARNYQALLRLCRSQQAVGVELVAAQCREGFTRMAAGATQLESRALGFEQLDIIEAWCQETAKKLEDA